jgi:hypothetical protein
MCLDVTGFTKDNVKARKDYQEEIEIDQNVTVFDGACLTELDTGDVELLYEEAGPSKKRLQKSKHLLERQERCE